MLTGELLEQCERLLRASYAVKVAHTKRHGPWQWEVDVSHDGGGIVSTAHATLGAAVRLASNALKVWVARFGATATVHSTQRR